MPSVDLWQADKWAHIAVYLLLAFLLYRSLLHVGVARAALVSALIASGFGYGIELIQAYFCQGRMYDHVDVLANGLGAVLGAGAGTLRNRTKR